MMTGRRAQPGHGITRRASGGSLARSAVLSVFVGLAVAVVPVSAGIADASGLPAQAHPGTGPAVRAECTSGKWEGSWMWDQKTQKWVWHWVWKSTCDQGGGGMVDSGQ